MPCGHHYTNTEITPEGRVTTCNTCKAVLEDTRPTIASQVNQAWNPGGWQAKKKGCTCPRLDNQEGKGRRVDADYKPFSVSITHYFHIEGDFYYIVAKDCELHANTPRNDPTGRPNDS